MGYDRINAISNINIIHKSAYTKLKQTEYKIPAVIVQPKESQQNLSLYSDMGLEIKGDSKKKEIHPPKAQVPKKTKDIPEPMSPHENMFLNTTFPEMANTIYVYPDNSYVEYDKKGHLINIREEDGKLKLHRIQNRGENSFKKYTYDKNGNCTREVTFNQNGKVTMFIDRKYDNKGKNVQDICYIDGEIEYFVNSIYDDNNRIIAKNKYNSNGELFDFEDFEYYRNTLPAKITPQQTITYSDMFLVQKIYNANKEETVGNITIKYDENGYAEKIYQDDTLKFEIFRFGKDEISFCREYEFNKDGKPVCEKIYNERGYLESLWTYEYENGNRIKDIQYKNNGEPKIFYEHKYDENNERTLTTQYDAVTGKKEAEFLGGEFFSGPGNY